jgi:hypothetical protein
LQILKYNLPTADCNLQISWGATFMSVLQRDGGFVVYFRGNPESKDTYTETYRFVFLNTGDIIDDEMQFKYQFIGTFKTDNIIRHLFMHKLG